MPDGSAWGSPTQIPGTEKFSIHTDLSSEIYCRGDDWTAYVNHPNGSRALFTFTAITELYATENPIEDAQFLHACESNPLAFNYLGNKGIMSYKVTNKLLTLADGTQYNWKYEYEGLPDTRHVNSVPNLKWQITTNPDGTKTRHWINRVKKSNQYNTIKSTEYFAKGDDPSLATPIKVVEYNYAKSRPIGYVTPQSETSPTFNYHLNLNSTLATYHYTDGSDIYIKEYEYEDDITNPNFSFGKPTKIISCSTVSSNLDITAANCDAVGQSRKRIESISYKSIKSPWLPALPNLIEVNNKIFDEYIYDRDTGLVVEYKQFGQTKSSYQYHGVLDNPSTCVVEAQIETCADGLLLSVIKPKLNETTRVTKYSNYKRGIPRLIKTPDKRASVTIKDIELIVDDNGWVKSRKDAAGFVTTYDHNVLGWLTSIVPPLPSYPTLISYENKGHGIIQTQTHMNKETVTYYDGFNRPKLIEQNDLSHKVDSLYSRFKYNYKSQIVFKSVLSYDSNELSGIETQYDSLGRVIQRKENYGNNYSTNYTYQAGNITQITDPDNYLVTNHASGYGSPNDGNITLIESPEDVNTEMSYDIYGNLKSIRQYGNSSGYNVDQTHQYFYDEQFRLCRQSIPELHDKIYEYNSADLVAAYAEGQASIESGITDLSLVCPEITAGKTKLIYDDMERNLKTDFPDNTSDIENEYDANGNLKILTRGTTTWNYDYYPNGWLKEESLIIDGLNFKTIYEKNGYGYIDKIRYPSGDLVQFSPDVFGRATESTIDDYIYAENIKYHPNSAIESFEFGNGALFTQTLNERYFPNKRSTKFNDIRQNPLDFEYIYDARGNIQDIYNHLNPSLDITNTYDGLSRLSSASGIWGNTIFTYDSLGNIRKRIIHKGLTHWKTEIDYTLNNQVDRVNHKNQWKNFEHDPRGNVTYNGNQTLVYDAANQPVSFTTGDTNHSINYDGNLKRVKQISGTATTYSIYTKEAGLVSQYDKTNQKHTDYIRIANTLIARVESKGSLADTSTTPFNELFTPTISDNGLLWQEQTMPYGQPVNNPTLNSSNVGFIGHIKDDSGLVYMQARYYDPVIGRFYSNDPVGYTAANPVMSFNRYLYVNNNPYKYKDPNGEFLANAIGAIVGAAIDAGIQYATTGEVNMAQVGVAAVAGATGVGLANYAKNAAKLWGAAGTTANKVSQVATNTVGGAAIGAQASLANDMIKGTDSSTSLSNAKTSAVAGSLGQLAGTGTSELVGEGISKLKSFGGTGNVSAGGEALTEAVADGAGALVSGAPAVSDALKDKEQ